MSNPVSPKPQRRGFFAFMALSVGAAYGFLAYIAGRFLFPAQPRQTSWRYVCHVKDLAPGSSLTWRSPAGETIAVARKVSGTGAAAFVALSSTCPHLGCQVHWQVAQERFFCPCHNGVFDADGKATEGPPAKEGQQLERYELELRGELLFISVPVSDLTAQADGVVAPAENTGPGQDPCLQAPELRRSC